MCVLFFHRILLTIFYVSILWGSCEMCLAATQDFAGIGAVRFLLGFTEGAVAPSFMIITSNWYCRREHPTRIAYVLI